MVPAFLGLCKAIHSMSNSLGSCRICMTGAGWLLPYSQTSKLVWLCHSLQELDWWDSSNPLMSWLRRLLLWSHLEPRGVHAEQACARPCWDEEVAWGSTYFSTFIWLLVLRIIEQKFQVKKSSHKCEWQMQNGVTLLEADTRDVHRDPTNISSRQTRPAPCQKRFLSMMSLQEGNFGVVPRVPRTCMTCGAIKITSWQYAWFSSSNFGQEWSWEMLTGRGSHFIPLIPTRCPTAGPAGNRSQEEPGIRPFAEGYTSLTSGDWRGSALFSYLLCQGIAPSYLPPAVSFITNWKYHLWLPVGLWQDWGRVTSSSPWFLNV